MFLLFALRQFSCYFVRFCSLVLCFAYSLFAFSVVFRTWNLFLHDVGVGVCCFLLCIKKKTPNLLQLCRTRRRRRQLLAQRRRRQDETMTATDSKRRKRKTSTRNKRKALPLQKQQIAIPYYTHTRVHTIKRWEQRAFIFTHTHTQFANICCCFSLAGGALLISVAL